MAEIEKIRGNAVLKLLTDLHRDKTPLKIRWADEDEEYSTHIADIRKRKRTLHFLITSRQDFLKAGDPANPSQLRFEFIDKENIKYVFETAAGEVSREMMWVAFPKSIHRYQRRSLFRLEAPHGTRLYFNINDIDYKLLVINVSLGGTLGVLVSLSKRMEHELTLHKSQTLQNVELLFPPKNQKEQASVVKIKSCRIKRQQRNPLTQKFECAIEFKEIEEDEQKRLTQLFYRWQREYLRRRKLMGV
jgi:c-di-GMP-binding flagellar brake protein YcgR